MAVVVKTSHAARSRHAAGSEHVGDLVEISHAAAEILSDLGRFDVEGHKPGRRGLVAVAKGVHGVGCRRSTRGALAGCGRGGGALPASRRRAAASVAVSYTQLRAHETRHDLV